ncbi:Norsolorinic acid ketoreductase [Daldinia childiae]|uniref:Norsolorinic acid ketoreductase n=1 Tax=Daldinia childiae TaxID=326645 RepID=UPI0014483544|nr:Norsolorinic acid ketoreductase [Daldinia childiae]KAF3068443.1 Norsolorinic acid ketoreductase [Daldinia childiae]
MILSTPGFIAQLQALVLDPTPRPGLHPIPGSQPLTFSAAVMPPLTYYIALLLLAPPPPPIVDSVYIKVIRNILALISGVLFFRLPLAYHVPQSIGLTYQLGLVGLYGGCRVIDAFFISPYFFKHIPRRVKYVHKPRVEISAPAEAITARAWSDGGVKEPYSHQERAIASDEILVSKSTQVEIVPNRSCTQTSEGKRSSFPIGISHAARRMSNSIPDVACDSYYAVQRTLHGPDPQPVLETATTECGWPRTLRDRASWALELELSMRGVGFTWTTADVRHTRRTWLPTVSNRVHSILVHTTPVLLVTMSKLFSAFQGIGRALVEAYLSRPNQTIIGAVRNPESITLKNIKPAEGSKLLVVKIEATSETDHAVAVDQIKAAGINALDVVIAVAGINPSSAFVDAKDMDINSLRNIFDVNTLSFVRLFNAVYPLLKASASSPKLLVINSNAGQIIEMEPSIPVKIGAIGLTTWVMNPDFMQTATGNAHAKIWGMEKAPHSLEDIIPGLMGKIDEATRAETSGNFYNFDGTPLTY